jgi:hypothetical protein
VPDADAPARLEQRLDAESSYVRRHPKSPVGDPAPIFVDLSVLTSVRHLAAALLLARALHVQVHVSKDDLHRVYSFASGIYPSPGYNEQMWQFSEFFDLYHGEMVAALPPSPPLSDPSASIVLFEAAVQRGWAETIYGEWGLAHVEIEGLLGLPKASREEFHDWEDSLSNFLRQHPRNVGRRELESLGELGSDATEVVALPKEPSTALHEASRDIGGDYFADNKREGWYIHDFGAEPWDNPYIRRGVQLDLHEGAILGIWFVCDGTREYLTRTRSSQPILRLLTPEHRSLIQTNSTAQAKLVKALLRPQRDVRVEDLLEVLENAAALNLVLDALELDERDQSASIRTYISAVGKLFTPRFGQLLLETVQFAIRRRRRSHIDW